MTLFGRTISRITLAALGAILVLALIAFGVNQYSKRRAAASQARVDNAQAQAAQVSAKDAIEAVAKAGEAAAASEELTRTNEQAIRAAPGADARVDMAVHAAGLAALCRRQSYASEPRCAPFRKEAK